MVPPAPVRLSITICWPKLSASFCATARPAVSMLPPGGYGMMSRTGLSGYAANADAAEKTKAVAEASVRITLATPGVDHAAADRFKLRKRQVVRVVIAGDRGARARQDALELLFRDFEAEVAH